MTLLSDPTSVWSVIGERLAFMSPVILVQLLGMLTALIFIRGRVGPSLCVVFALGAMLLFSVGGMIAHELIMHNMYMDGRPYEDIRPFIIAISVVQTLVHAGSLTLLIIAALTWRRKATPVA